MSRQQHHRPTGPGISPLTPGRAARRTALALCGVAVSFALAGCVPYFLPSTQAAATATPAVPVPDGPSVLRTAPYNQLAIGDCTNISANSEIVDTVQVLDCAGAHPSEVFWTLKFPEAATPSLEAQRAFAGNVCGAYADHLPASVTWFWVGPSTEEWASGDRFGLCLAADSSGQALTAPLSRLEGDATPAPATAPLPTSTLRDLILGFAAVFIPALALGVAFSLASYLVWALALMSLFRKVGVPVWKAWVPYVQTWTLLRLGGQNGNWMWLAFVPYGSIVTAVFLVIGMHRIGIAFGKDSGMLVLGIFLPFVWAFILGGSNEPYQPQLLAWRGYPPPLEGYGAIPTT